jgi:hypothetical protein
MDISISFLVPDLSRPGSDSGCLFQVQFASTDLCFSGVAANLSSDAIDYDADLVFNQTNWNDDLDQEN